MYNFFFTFFLTSQTIFAHNMFWTFFGNSMNNLSSYFGLIDSRMRASDTDLHVRTTYLPRLFNVFKERPLARKGVQNHLSNKCKQIINSPMGGSSSLQYTIHTFRVDIVVTSHGDIFLVIDVNFQSYN